jgi:hypothetical protein
MRQYLVDTQSFCYKQDKVSETPFYFRVPVVLAKPMRQRYWDDERKKWVWEAKTPEELKKFTMMDYMTNGPTDVLPSFENHPKKENKKLEVGFVKNVRWDDRYGIVGVAYVNKKLGSETLFNRIRRGEPIDVSIGFYRDEGPPGKWEDKPYDISQTNIQLTHLAILPESEGRCSIRNGCGLNQKIDMGVKIPGNIQRRLVMLDHSSFWTDKKQLFLDILDSTYEKPSDLFPKIKNKLKDAAGKLPKVRYDG